VESHNIQARDIDLDMALNHHVLTDDEIDTALENAPPVEPSEGFRERALKAMREAWFHRATKLN
jgi:hypothetical protein